MLVITGKQLGLLGEASECWAMGWS